MRGLAPQRSSQALRDATLMRPTTAVAGILALTFLAAPAAAHGALAINELETYAISDFEGQEDSFAWEGFEIWDVYVGDGYDAIQDADGVYFKVNLAGDGTQRPTESAAWTVNISFKAGEETIEREIVHDGVDVTTTFEALEWTIADGNVFQVKAWTPIPDWKGKAVSDIVIVSSVDGEPRDTAPGGIHAPGTGTEIPVEAPSTVIFPPMGEGRIVEQVELTGPAKFIDVTVTPLGNGVFDFTVKNPLKEQGQHVHMREPTLGSWSMSSPLPSVNLEGGASATFKVALNASSMPGVVEPLILDLYTDIGGRHLYYAYLENSEVKVLDDPTLATASAIEPAQEAPGLGLPATLMLLAVALALAFNKKR